MIKMRLVIAFVLSLFLGLNAAANKNQKQKELELKAQELETLRGRLDAARDSLQMEIASRWRVRQLNFEQRERDKEELVLLHEKVERLRNEFAHIKEECYSKELAIGTEQKKTSDKKEQWNYLAALMDDILNKEPDRVLQSFPIDIEERRMDLEILRRRFSADRNAAAALVQLVSWFSKYIEKGGGTAIIKTTILPEQGDPQDVTLARFGNVFGYGVNRESELFIIRQSGNQGSGRYVIEQLGPSALNSFLSSSFPQWIGEQGIKGPLMFDIMQNTQASTLIKGQKIDRTESFKQFVRDGGPVMIPLGILVIWALILIFWKLIVFSSKYTADYKISRTVMKHLDNNEIAKAHDYIKNHRGVVAKVASTCLEQSKWSRVSAEKAVKEILLAELPRLNKHLNTLAVIAATAPLLGLLGTVTGMINLFEVITNYGTGDPKILAAGISEALITTEVGLIIAIPVLLIHNFLRNRAHNIQTATEKYTISILNRLWPET